MKIFLDVGSNQGQTISSILDPVYGFNRTYCRYGFHRIYSFEPVPALHELVSRKYRGRQFVFFPVGLWKETCEKPIYSPGSQSGSIFADKINVDPAHSIICKFVRVSDWFRDYLAETDEVYVKLNCEGSEVDIIEDLLDSNEYRKITSLGVSFDVKKIPSQRDREEQIKLRLQEQGYTNCVDLDLIPISSRRQRIQTWLSAAGAEQYSLTNRLAHIAYCSQSFLARVFRYSRGHIRTLYHPDES
jgi:FkbM family methyltransferase